MNKQRFLIMSFVLIFSFSLASIAKAEAMGKTEESIFEKDLVINDTDNFDIIFDTAEITVKKAKEIGIKGLEKRYDEEKIKVKYPKVICFRDKVKFLDFQGKVKKEVLFPNKETIIDGSYEILEEGNINISRNQEYIAITRFVRGKYLKMTIDNYDYDLHLYEVSIFDTNGNLVRTIKQINPNVFISPNGEYIVGSNDAVPISIFNEKGLVKVIKTSGKNWQIDFSKDGSWFAIIIEMVDRELMRKATTKEERIKARKFYLLVCDSKGNELWRVEDIAQKGGTAYCQIRITEDDKIKVMTGVGDYIKYIFDKNGKLLKKEQGTLKELNQGDF